MASAEEPTPDLKAGHAPAVKVGGMRVVQQKKHGHEGTGDAKNDQLTPEEEEEFGASSPPKSDKHHQSILLSGAITKGDKDFPEAAVKATHVKPLPSHEKRPAHQQFPIHQPKKM